MSSIYKKGRDGYFYYQAYINNPETGKKDKRVYHSLNTKDRLVAKDKQIFFDQKYSNQNKTKVNIFQKSLLILVFLSILLVLSKQITSNSKYYNNEKANIEVSSDHVNVVVKTNNDTVKLNPIIDLTETSMENFKNESESDNSIISEKNKILKYTIVRQQSLRDRFDQVKVFATAPPKLKQIELESICKKIKNDFDEYTNILICIYAETEEGILMAKGLGNMINKPEERKAWLAMYSFNPTEGEYFDNEPSYYLGQGN